MQLLGEVGFPTPISNEVCDGIMRPGQGPAGHTNKVVQQDGGGCQEGPHQAQEDGGGLQAPEQCVCQADPCWQVSLPPSSLGAARLLEDLSGCKGRIPWHSSLSCTLWGKYYYKLSFTLVPSSSSFFVHANSS